MKDETMLFWRKIFEYLFESSFFAMLVFFSAEYLKEGIVTNYLNFLVVLTLTIIFGIIVIVFSKKKENRMNIWKRILLYVFFLFFAIFFSFAIERNMGDSHRLLSLFPVLAGTGLYMTFLLIWEI